MRYAKIIVKNNYEKRGDLVLRSYIRALKKINESRLLDGDNAVIYGVVNENGEFHELFTNEIIDFDEYIYVNIEEIFDVAMMPDDRKELLTRVMQKVLFRKERVFLDFEVSSLQDLSDDRYVEMEAYEKGLSGIIPYPRLSENDEQLYGVAFDVLALKIRAIKKIRRLDRCSSRDEYDIENYEALPRTKGQYVKR